ncbi:unnamed protein product [Diamesa serratosioi]
MDFQSAMETFAEAWVAANVGTQTQALALTRPKSPKLERSRSPPSLFKQCDSLRSPINELHQQLSSPKTPVAVKTHTPLSDTSSSNLNSSNLNSISKITTSQLSLTKSLPLHCVVESVPSLQASYTLDTRSPWRRRPNIETDSYVIIPAATPFCDIVSVALQRLGYSSDIANTARGAIIIKNWKPHPLDKVTDNTLISVNEILGELTSIVTLKITIIRTKPTQLAEIKDKLLKLLILQSHTVLRSTGCPLDEITLSQICRSPLQNHFPFTPEITDDVRRKFDQWWASQLTPQANPMAHKILPFMNPQSAELDFASAAAAAAAAHNLHPSRDPIIDNHHSAHPSMIVHPALQTVHTQYPNQKTRMRTSFDPEMELPKLQRWFQENPHPSRQQIQSYVVQLNSLESRRGRKPLDVNNVVYWFKNARAAQKRAETRGHLSNGYSTPSGLIMPHAEYMKSSPSAPSDDIDNISQHSDDMDDDLDRPMSPQLPLQLTVHERNRPMSSPINIECEPKIKLEDERSCSSPPANNNEKIKSNNNSSNGTNNSEHASEHNVSFSSNRNNNNDESVKSNNSIDHSSNSPQPRSPSPSEDLDIDDQEMSQMDEYHSPSPDSKRDLPFSMVNPNSMFSAHSIMYMSHYIPAMQNAHHQSVHGQNHPSMNTSGLNLSNSFNSNDERRKRNRTFIDPVTEVPKLEQWFSMNTHPSHNLILKYTEDLNRMPYRQKFPRLESKNVQFWFKNRRAKCKRLKMSLYDSPSQLSGLNPFHSTSDRE